jgi:Bacteriocin-protection, YdeI or OmpD-Associated/Domain of unknown function (DUF1905)
MRFRAELQLDGQTATGITVPPEVLEGLGAGKRPAVRVTINGYTYPSTIGTMNGVAKVPVSGAVRAAAKVNAGDVLEVEVEADDTSRTVTVPDDLGAALAGDPDSRAFFDGLSYSHKNAYVSWIEQAKKPGTRQKRVAETAALLARRRQQH